MKRSSKGFLANGRFTFVGYSFKFKIERQVGGCHTDCAGAENRFFNEITEILVLQDSMWSVMKIGMNW